MSPSPWHCRGRVVEFGRRPLVMGIVNVTPDSFSDGGHWFDSAKAVDHAIQLVAEGADILDIGGESTRPGAEIVSLEEEIRRVVSVVAEVAKRSPALISIDTSKAEVARRCLDAGAAIVNDVTGLCDPDMVRICAEASAGVVIMHMQGNPRTMQVNPHYGDVVGDVAAYFEARLRELQESGIDPAAVCIDPGIGFGKTREHNLDLLANLGALGRFGRPLCLGVSRKGFIDRVCGRPLADRMPGSLAVACFSAARGDAHVLRVHDVGPTRDAALLLDAIDRYRR